MKNLMRLLKAAWRDDRRLVLVRMGQNLFEALVPMADILGIGAVVDVLITGQSRERVFTVVTAYVLVHFGISLTRDLLAWGKDIAERKSTNAVQYKYARQSLEVDFPYIQTGGFLSLKRKSMKIMPAFYIRTLGEFLSYIVKFVGIFWIFTAIHPLLILCIAVLSVPMVLMSFRRKKAEYQYRRDATGLERKRDYLYKVMTDYPYAKDIRIYGGEELLSDKYTENTKEQIQKLSGLGRNNARVQTIAYLFYGLQLLCMLIVFSIMVYRKDISIAEYTVLLSSTTLFASIVTGFFENLAEIKEMCSYADLMGEYDSFISENSKVYRSENREGDMDWSSVSIDFEHVTFRYPGREEAVLKDVSFHISPGEKVSFAGLNGAGKTTIINLLMRLYPPDQGTVRINGIDIQEIAEKDYYEHIGSALQNFFLFAYPVRENLCFGTDRGEEKMTDALDKAGLKERIRALPKGIDTSLYRELDPEGVELSGGEGQKLAMARALVKEAPLLILDEPTSSLDPLAEYELFSRVRRLAEDKTMILVSHRLSSARFSDRIFLFEAGRLVQSGSHGELIGREGLYGELYRTQARYYTGEDGLYEE